MQSTNYAYVNGRFVPENEAVVSIFDRGFLYGDGVFETMRVYGGKIFRLEPHLARLADGLAKIKIEPPLSNEEIRAVCMLLVERNRVLEGLVRVYVTSGRLEGVQATFDQRSASLVIVAIASEPTTLEFRAIVSTFRVDGTISRLKTANRLPYLLAREQARGVGAHEAILLNHAGRVVEFSTSNIFVVKRGELFTPPLEDGPLPGITRDIVLMLAGQQRTTVYELSIAPEFLKDADEIFATNSLLEVVPVTMLANRVLPSRVVGLGMRRAYQKFVREELSTPAP